MQQSHYTILNGRINPIEESWDGWEIMGDLPDYPIPFRGNPILIRKWHIKEARSIMRESIRKLLKKLDAH